MLSLCISVVAIGYSNSTNRYTCSIKNIATKNHQKIISDGSALSLPGGHETAENSKFLINETDII
jgi:hypothetical protein